MRNQKVSDLITEIATQLREARERLQASRELLDNTCAEIEDEIGPTEKSAEADTAPGEGDVSTRP